MAHNNALSEQNRSNEIQMYKGGGLIVGGEGKVTKKADVPQAIVDVAVQGLKTAGETKELVEAAKNSGEQIFKVVLKPELQEGLQNGTLTWDNCSATLRRADNKRIAGQIVVEKLDNNALSKAQAVASGLTKVICSVSGQVQLAEINKKLGKIQETVDLIRKEGWRDRISDLRSLSNSVHDALEFNNKENTRIQIHSAIQKIAKHEEFFRQSIESKLHEEIQIHVMDSFWESFLYWIGKRNHEYNEKYINKIKELLGDYAFFVDFYLEAQALLFICYQFIEEHTTANKCAEDTKAFMQDKNEELYGKILYLFDIVDTSQRTSKQLSNIDPMIKKQGIDMSAKFAEVDEKINPNNRHILIGTDACIEIDVPISLFEEDTNND